MVDTYGIIIHVFERDETLEKEVRNHEESRNAEQ